MLGFLLLRGEDPADVLVLAGTCKRLSGEAGTSACDRAIASGKGKGAELVSLYEMRGYRRHERHDIEGALADYREAIRLDPANAGPLNARGTIYRDAGNYDRALADFDKAVALKEWADPYASRGWIYSQKGEHERARQDFAKALSLDPDQALKDKLQAALGGSSTSEPPAAGLGFFGPDTRKSLSEFSEADRAKLAASYAYVGTLVKGHTAVCNATLVGRSLILTSDYCFDGSGLSNYSFRSTATGARASPRLPRRRSARSSAAFAASSVSALPCSPSRLAMRSAG